MTPARWVEIVEWLSLAYVAAANLGYLALNILSFFVLRRGLERQALEILPRAHTDFEPPVSIIVPAHNEEATVVASVRSLLQLHYASFEIVVVNDGSKDGTLAALKDAFGLKPFPEAHHVRLETARVRGVYHSPDQAHLRVIDKENGGKSDALNAGINAARYPLFCALDADSVLQPDSVRRIVRPFLEDPRTVACGGIIKIANGCEVAGGWLVRAGVPRRLLARFQVVEYCRAFLFGRLAWSPVNGLLVISGAFGLFHKDTVIAAGGYRTDTVGEDMELVVRLHRVLRAAGKPYRITFVPDPVCWTEAPETLRVLKSQRVRWQRGLCESLTLNRALLFNPRGGFVGWAAFPFALLFEWLSPILEVFGYLFFLVGYLAGAVELEFVLAFMVVAIGFGILLSVTALLLDEMSYHTYPKTEQVLQLLAAAVLENFGYRQINTWWRLQGLLEWATGAKQKWGDMTRTAGWSADVSGTRPISVERP